MTKKELFIEAMIQKYEAVDLKKKYKKAREKITSMSLVKLIVFAILTTYAIILVISSLTLMEFNSFTSKWHFVSLLKDGIAIALILTFIRYFNL